MRSHQPKLVLVLMFCWLCACRPNVPPAPNARNGHDYIDLEAGWIVRVVIPLSKSGVLTNFASAPVGGRQERAGTLTSVAPKDFAGYATDYYQVSARDRGGVRVTFQKAEVTRDGQTVSQPKAVAPMFQLPASARYVRLLFLMRVSDADHNMAVLASSRMDRLAELTLAVQKDRAGCVSTKDAHCYWVPAGFALRPEQPTTSQAAKP
jgi:hypothetical protein